MADPALESIGDALEAAFVLARREAAEPGSPPAPRLLRPVLGFNRLQDRAWGQVRQALDQDDEFRSRVLDSIDERELRAQPQGEGSWLFLARPEGWRQALDALVGDAVQAADRTAEEQREQDAVRRLALLEAAHAELKADRDQMAAEVEQLRGELSDLGREDSRNRAALQASIAELEQLGSARVETVRQLKEAEVLAVQRLDRSRELESELEQLRATPRDEIPDVSPGEVAAAPVGADEGTPGAVAVAPTDTTAARVAPSVDAAAAAARELASALEMVAATLAGDPAGSTDTGPGPPTTEVPEVNGAAADPVRSHHRRPVRIGRGLSADSPAGLTELLARAETLVLVDGYNVSMQGWPQQPPSQQRRSLLAMLGSLESVAAARIHVVFDGAYDGSRPTVGAPLPVRVHFTESGVEADDRLLEFVDAAPVEVAVVVVSSDNRVRDGARARGANVVSSESLLARGRGR